MLRRPMMIASAACALATFLAITTTTHAQEAVRIGFSDSPPISSRIPTTGELQGLAVSIFTEIANEAGFAPRADLLSFGALLPALTGMKTDVVTMSGTPERRRVAIFSQPFARYGEALLVRAEDTKAYVGIDELKGMRVGSNAGGGWLDAAQKAGAEIMTFEGAEFSLQALEKGDVQAVVGNAPTYTYLLRGGAYPHVRMVPTYIPRQTNELAFGVRLADGPLLARIDAALGTLSARGVLERYRSDWGF